MGDVAVWLDGAGYASRAVILPLLLALWSSLALAGELRLAVGPFDDATDAPETEHLGRGLQAMVTTDLVQVEGLTVVERARLQDVLDELSLGTEGLLEPSSAAEVGRLLGATHVVSGAYTLDRGTLRLDARLTVVETGEILVAAEATGERDAFFELEKEVVAGLLAALEQQPAPAERARIARIHTADFAALSAFGEGLALYDAHRYEEAARVLEGVSRRDSGFELARRTLEEVQALQAALSDRIEAVRVTEAEGRFLARQAEAGAQAAQVERLYRLAADSETPETERWTALLLLAEGLGTGYHTGRFSELARTADDFAMKRAGEQAFQQLWDELHPRMPEVTPRLDYDWGSWFGRELTPEEVDEDFARTFAYLHGSAFDGERRLRTLRDCVQFRLMGEREPAALWLPASGRAELLTWAATEHPQCFGGVGHAHQVGAALEAAERWRELQQLSTSGAILEALVAEVSDPRQLQRVERALAQEAHATAVLDDPRLDALAREILLLQPSYVSADSAWRTGGMRAWAAGPEEGRWYLNQVLRAWPQRGLLWVGREPVWMLPWLDQREVVTGRRSDPLRAESIRYYGDDAPRREVYATIGGPSREVERPPEPVRPAHWILGGRPVQDLRLSVVLDHVPAEDFVPRQRARPEVDGAEPPLASGQPRVGLLFGLQDIATPDVCDPVRPQDCEAVPLRGLGVILDAQAEELRLVAVTEVPAPPELPQGRFPGFVYELEETEVLARGRLRPGEERSVLLAVSGAAVTVEVEGRELLRHVLPAPPRRGFVGLSAHGLGYVEVRELELR